MMERYEELWKMKKQQMMNQGFNPLQPIKIKVKNNEQEHKWSNENMIKKGWREIWDTKYATEEIEENNQIKEIELDHIEYADDTSIVNASIEEEVPKLECYRKSAEEYELEIQWKKTFILRKNIPKKDDGKAAGLPAPFNEVKQSKTERMLGLQIGINGAQQEMIKDRLDKAQKGWNIGQKFFLNTKIDKKARIQLFNASIRPILQYGMTSQKVSDINIKNCSKSFLAS